MARSRPGRTKLGHNPGKAVGPIARTETGATLGDTIDNELFDSICHEIFTTGRVRDIQMEHTTKMRPAPRIVYD